MTLVQWLISELLSYHAFLSTSDQKEGERGNQEESLGAQGGGRGQAALPVGMWVAVIALLPRS